MGRPHGVHRPRAASRGDEIGETPYLHNRIQKGQHVLHYITIQLNIALGVDNFIGSASSARPVLTGRKGIRFPTWVEVWIGGCLSTLGTGRMRVVEYRVLPQDDYKSTKQTNKPALC